MINHIFISFSAVQLYDLSYIHLPSSLSTGILRTYISKEQIKVTENISPFLMNLQNAEKLDLMQKAISAHTTYTKEVTNYSTSNPAAMLTVGLGDV